jgi:hypothetical protein
MVAGQDVFRAADEIRAGGDAYVGLHPFQSTTMKPNSAVARRTGPSTSYLRPTVGNSYPSIAAA